MSARVLHVHYEAKRRLGGGGVGRRSGGRRGGGGGVQVGNLYYTTAVQYQAMKAEVALARSPYMEIDVRCYKEKHGFL